MTTSSPTRNASFRSTQPRPLQREANSARSSTADLSVTRLEYAMLSEGSPNGTGSSREHVSIRQVSPPDSMNRKVFMGKLLSLSKLHVDEANGTDVRHSQSLAPRRIAFSMDNSLTDTLDETDVSEASPTVSTPPLATALQNRTPSKAASTETAYTALPAVKYVLDLLQQTVNMECIGFSCNALQVKCEAMEDLDDFEDIAPRSSPNPSTSNFSQSYRSTDDEYGDFDSFYSTFDETIDDQDASYMTGPLYLRDQADIAKVSRFDDTTTLSSQNSEWL